jgi:hypothetical protein
MATERDDYAARLSERYAEKYEGLRQQIAAMDRNVLRLIAEGRDRGEVVESVVVQVQSAVGQLGICANELMHIKFWGRILIGVIALLVIGMIALLVRVF